MAAQAHEIYPSPPQSDPALEAIVRDGYAVLPGLLDAAQVRAIKAELAPFLQGRLMGRNDFEVLCSERVYALLAKAPAIAWIIEHPRVLAIADHFLRPNYLLSACLAINVHRGETPQGWHGDDGMCQVPSPRPMQGLSAIWAFDDFAEDNGATEVIPRSHLWGDDEPPPRVDDPRAVKVLMPAGSAVVFAGNLRHRGGAHCGEGTRLGITPQYCQPWFRQIENMPLAVPPPVAAQYSERIQALLGYSIMEPTFVGYVDGMHPRRLIDPHHGSRKQRQRADTKLMVPPR